MYGQYAGGQGVGGVGVRHNFFCGAQMGGQDTWS